MVTVEMVSRPSSDFLDDDFTSTSPAQSISTSPDVTTTKTIQTTTRPLPTRPMVLIKLSKQPHSLSVVLGRHEWSIPLFFKSLYVWDCILNLLSKGDLKNLAFVNQDFLYLVRAIQFASLQIDLRAYAVAFMKQLIIERDISLGFNMDVNPRSNPRLPMLAPCIRSLDVAPGELGLPSCDYEVLLDMLRQVLPSLTNLEFFSLRESLDGVLKVDADIIHPLAISGVKHLRISGFYVAAGVDLQTDLGPSYVWPLRTLNLDVKLDLASGLEEDLCEQILVMCERSLECLATNVPGICLEGQRRFKYDRFPSLRHIALHGTFCDLEAQSALYQLEGRPSIESMVLSLWDTDFGVSSQLPRLRSLTISTWNKSLVAQPSQPVQDFLKNNTQITHFNTLAINGVGFTEINLTDVLLPLMAKWRNLTSLFLIVEHGLPSSEVLDTIASIKTLQQLRFQVIKMSKFSKENGLFDEPCQMPFSQLKHTELLTSLEPLQQLTILVVDGPKLKPVHWKPTDNHSTGSMSHDRKQRACHECLFEAAELYLETLPHLEILVLCSDFFRQGGGAMQACGGNEKDRLLDHLKAMFLLT